MKHKKANPIVIGKNYGDYIVTGFIDKVHRYGTLVELYEVTCIICGDVVSSDEVQLRHGTTHNCSCYTVKDKEISRKDGTVRISR